MPQFESHTSAVEIFIFSETMGTHEYSRSPQDFWSNQFRLFFWKICIYYIFCWHLKRPTCFESYKCTLFMSVHVGEKKKKRGWQCNIWFSTLLHSMFSLYASLAILPYVWFQKYKNLIFCEIVFMGCAKVWRRSHKCLCLSFSFPPSVITMVCQNFPITVCGINLSQQTVSLLAILQ